MHRILAAIAIVAVADGPALGAQSSAVDSIAVGGIELRLGMDEAEALRLLSSVYILQPIEGSVGTWGISRKAGQIFEPVGSVTFAKRQLVSASAQRASSSDERTNAFALSLVNALKDSFGTTAICRLTTRVHTATNFPMTEATIVCGSRRITILGGSNRDYAATVSELLISPGLAR